MISVIKWEQPTNLTLLNKINSISFSTCSFIPENTIQRTVPFICVVYLQWKLSTFSHSRKNTHEWLHPFLTEEKYLFCLTKTNGLLPFRWSHRLLSFSDPQKTQLTFWGCDHIHSRKVISHLVLFQATWWEVIVNKCGAAVFY